MTKEKAINAFKEWIERDKKIEYADRLENIEIYKLAIKVFEAWEKVEKDIHTAIDNALMYGYGDNYINACENILKIMQKQEKCLKMDEAESEEV